MVTEITWSMDQSRHVSGKSDFARGRIFGRGWMDGWGGGKVSKVERYLLQMSTIDALPDCGLVLGVFRHYVS